MRRFFLKALFISTVMMTAGACLSIEAAPGNPDFSADMVMRSSEGVLQGKVYVGQNKHRMEMAGNIVLSLPDQNKTLVLMPAQKMYMEQALQADRMPKTAKEVPGETERVALGTELIEGKTVQKFKVTFTEQGAQHSLFQWLDDDLPVPVKMEAEDGSWSVEYRNIHLGPQDKSLFEVPADYQKFQIPGMPGGADLLRSLGGQDGGQ